MKAYVMTTGAAFGLLTLVHIWRVIEEGPHLATTGLEILEQCPQVKTIVVSAGTLWARDWAPLRFGSPRWATYDKHGRRAP